MSITYINMKLVSMIEESSDKNDYYIDVWFGGNKMNIRPDINADHEGWYGIVKAGLYTGSIIVLRMGCHGSVGELILENL